MLFFITVLTASEVYQKFTERNKTSPFILGECELRICNLYFVLHLVYISVLQKASCVGMPLCQSHQQTSTENIKKLRKNDKKFK